jgi:hypothetical protein
MAVAFVKNHTVAADKAASSTTYTLALATDVPAGNLIVARLVYDNAATASKPLVTSIGRAAGETNNWATAVGVNSTSTSAGAFASGAMTYIRTTVVWPAGNYTVTLDTAVTQKSGLFSEFSGVLATPSVSTVAGTNYSTTTTAASAATTGTAPVIGDLVLGLIFGSNVAAAMAGDTDTTGGSWSAVAGFGTTGGNVATNNFGIGQYKILTAASHQTLNNSAAMTAGNGAIVLALQQYIPPAITQAAYGFYNDGTETGATALTPTEFLADSYAETNAEGTSPIGQSASTTRIAQSFKGNGRPLTRASFYIRRVLAPAGNLTAVLYAHDGGTYGTTGLPTGTALATSTTAITSSTVSTTAAWVDFDFDGTFTPTDGTPYFIAIVISATAGLNDYIGVSQDSTGTHAGNYSTYTSSWGGLANRDVIFRIYTTGYVTDVTAGDVNLQLRERLQLTTAIATDATDDWQLQWEKNASGTWNNVAFSGTDFARGSGATLQMGTTATFQGFSQSFMGTGSAVTRVGVEGNRTQSNTTGTVVAKIYAHSGTYGTSSIPTGPALATSVPFDVSVLPFSGAVWYYLTFDGSFTPVNGTPYVLSCEVVSTSSDVTLRGYTPSVHGGNYARLASGVWTAVSTQDTNFELFTAANTIQSVDPWGGNVIDGQATTNRLGAGTGSFVAGKVSRDGLVDNLGWTGNNYTELLYSLRLRQDALTQGDTLRFRTLYNGATTSVTYTQTPTINVTKTLPAVTQAAYRWYDDGYEDGTKPPVPFDSYLEDNRSGHLDISSTQTALGQSFLGNGQPLRRASFHLLKTLTPIGTVVAKLYAHTGTFGKSTGLPTGTALATSTTSIVSNTLPTSLVWTDFDFDGAVTLTNGTPYFIVIEVAGITGGTVELSSDSSAPTHPGRLAQFTSSWASTFDYDLVFRLYSNITPSSTALAAQDTAASGDVTTADGIGQLRVRLQSTNAAPIPATDDWQLQWEKTTATATLADSYPAINYSSNVTSLLLGVPERGQSFLGNGGALTRAGFYMAKVGTPPGNIVAYLYAQTGTLGSVNDIPTGSPLATSTPVSAASVSTARSWVYFDFAGTFTLTNGTAYFLVLGSDTATVIGNSVDFGLDATTPTHAGTRSDWGGSSWTSLSGTDVIFEVYTKPVPTWTNVITGGTPLVDGYPETFADGTYTINAGGNTGFSQSFLGNGKTLSKALFWAVKSGLPTGNITAQLYTHSGTFGTSSVPGTLLATSAPYDVSTVPTAAAWVTFTFDETYTMANGTFYVIVIDSTTAGSVGHGVALSVDTTSPAHGGNVGFRSGVWNAVASADACFQIYSPAATTVLPYNSPNLTDGAATTNRLTGGTGTFTPGKISETGLVSDVGWSGNNYTELLYSLDIVNTAVANGDTLRFRVLRNGVVTSMTYTSVPTINLVKGAGAYTATLTATDGADTFTAAPAFGPTATLAQPDGRDTLVATGSYSTPSPDTGERFIESVVARTTEGDTPRYLESFVLPTLTATLASPDGQDIFAATPTFISTATVPVTDGRDTFTAVPTFGPTATITLTDGRDTLTAVPAFGPTAALALTDGRDSFTAVPVFVSSATLAFTDGRDSLTAPATFGPTATLAFADGPDTWSATEDSAPPVHSATLIRTDGADTLVSTGTFTSTGSLTGGAVATGFLKYRNFNGTGDSFNATSGSVGGVTTDTWTVAMCLKMNEVGDDYAIFQTYDAWLDKRGLPFNLFHGSAGGSQLGYWNQQGTGNFIMDGPSMAIANGCQIVVMAKDGTSPIEWSVYNFGTGLWTHTTSSLTDNNNPPIPAGPGYYMLLAGNAVACDFVCAGIWAGTKLTTTQRAALSVDFAAWSAASPTELFRLDLTVPEDSVVGTSMPDPAGLPSPLGPVGADSPLPEIAGVAAGATDGRDTLTAVATVSAPTYTATLAITDGQDILASTATEISTATLPVTDGLDTLVAAPTTTAPTFTATLPITDGRDTLTAVQTFGPTATLVITDGRDTLTAIPAFGPTAALVITDGADTILAAGTTTAPTFTATLIVTDAQDTLVAPATFGPTATVALIDGLDTLVASASATIPGSTSALTTTDGQDVLAATATYTFLSTLPVTDGRDTLVAAVSTVAPTHTGTIVVTDGLDTLAAAVNTLAPTHASTLLITDGVDTIVATSSATPPTHTATLPVTDGLDTLVAVGATVAPTFTSTAVATDGVDTITALVSAGAVGAAVMAIADGVDTLVAVGSTVAPTYTATLALTDGRDTLAATVATTAPTHTAILPVTDGLDTLVATVATVAPTFTAVLSQTDGVDTLTATVATVAPTHTATLIRTDGADTIVTAVSALPPPNPSTLALTDGTDTLAALVSAGAVGAAVLAVSDGADTITSTVTTTPPVHMSTLVLADGRDTLVPGVSTTAPTFTATASLLDGQDSLVASVNTVAPVHTAGLPAADGRDTLTATVVFTPAPNPSTLAITDGQDTLTASVATAAPGNSAGSLVSTDGTDVITAAVSIIAAAFAALVVTDGLDTLVAVAATEIDTVIGQWNGEDFYTMQYSDQTVTEWLLV